MTVKIDNFIDEYVDKLKSDEAGLFVGAGLSINSGMPSWKELLREPAESIGMDVDREEDLVTLAQYFVNENHNTRTRINAKLKSQFENLSQINENQKIIAQLPIDTIWTTNYDNLLERAFKQNGKICDVKRNKDDFTSSPKNSCVTFYKMHGDISDTSHTVITRREYEEYDRNFEMYVTALKSDLVRKTFLFVGYSFQDPNLRYILAQLRLLLNNSPREHFFIIRKPVKADGETEDDFDYRVNKHRLQIEDLEQYNIRAVEIENYEQITDILKKIKLKIKRDYVFLSSAQAPNQENNFDNLLTNLSYSLVKNNKIIVNGYGWQAGNAIVKGALMAIMEDPQKSIDEYLKVFPFPQIKNPDEDKEKIQEAWTKIRTEMLDVSGTAIFIAGNKMNEDDVVISDGMLEEFEIANKYDVTPIPVGYTGGASEDIFNIIHKNPNFYYNDSADVMEKVEELANKNLNEEKAIKLILSLV